MNNNDNYNDDNNKNIPSNDFYLSREGQQQMETIALLWDWDANRDWNRDEDADEISIDNGNDNNIAVTTSRDTGIY